MASEDLGLRVVILGVGEARRNMGAINNDLNTLTANFQKAAGVSSALASRISALGSGMAHLGRTMTLMTTLPIAAFGAGMLKAGIDFEDAFAGVSKTVEGVSDNFGNLTKLGKEIRTEFRQLALEIPTSAVELARLGEEAGALGVPASQITGFVKIIAQLGVATNVSAEEAGNAIARFANIMGVKSEDLAAFAKSAGSAIVDLGNKSAATESEIISMAYRLAGAGKAVNLTSQEILGLATSISELGVRSEQGGTAVSRILLEMSNAAAEGGDKLDIFAQAAGLTSDQFRELVKSSPIRAFAALSGGLARMQEEGRLSSETMADLGLNSIRLRDVINRFGPDMGNLTTNIQNANKAWAEGTALEIEAQKRYNTIKSQLQLLKNAFSELGIVIFDLYRDDIAKLIKGFGSFVKSLSLLNSSLIKTVAKFALLAAAAGPVLIIVGTLFQLIATGIAGLATFGALVGGLAVPFLLVASAAGAFAVALSSMSKIKVNKNTFKGLSDVGYWIGQAFKYGKNLKGGNIFTGIGSAIKALTYIYKDNKRTFFSQILVAFGMGQEQAQKLGMSIRNFLFPVLMRLSDIFNLVGKTFTDVMFWMGQGNWVQALRTVFFNLFRIFGLGNKQASDLVTALFGLASSIITFASKVASYFAENVLPILLEFSAWFISEFIPAAVPLLITISGKIADFITALADVWDEVSPSLTPLLEWFKDEALPDFEKFMTDDLLPALDRFIKAIDIDSTSLKIATGLLLLWKAADIANTVGLLALKMSNLVANMNLFSRATLIANLPLAAFLLIVLSINTWFPIMKDSINNAGKAIQEGDFTKALMSISMFLISIPLGIAIWIGKATGIDVPEGLARFVQALRDIKTIVTWIGDRLKDKINNALSGLDLGPLEDMWRMSKDIYNLSGGIPGLLFGIDKPKQYTGSYTPNADGTYGARGGVVTGPTIVGERGKELFMPNTTGFLLSNNMLKNIAGILSSRVMSQNTSNNYVNRSMTFAPTLNGVPMSNERSAMDELYRVYQTMQPVYGS